MIWEEVCLRPAAQRGCIKTIGVCSSISTKDMGHAALFYMIHNEHFFCVVLGRGRQDRILTTRGSPAHAQWARHSSFAVTGSTILSTATGFQSLCARLACSPVRCYALIYRRVSAAASSRKDVTRRSSHVSPLFLRKSLPTAQGARIGPQPSTTSGAVLPHVWTKRGTTRLFKDIEGKDLNTAADCRSTGVLSSEF